jgi:NTP pyrophosphatase (non-canonical NTP hydrolase)
MTDTTISDITEYVRAAHRTMAHDLEPVRELSVLTLGLIGEAGEFSEHVKKYLGHGHALDRDVLQKELGDVIWYWACLHVWLGLDPSVTLGSNIEKLRERYPQGFSQERSINR